jgi:small ligand-binding sensory domain FIST
VTHAVAQVREGLQGLRPSIVFMFLSPHHVHMARTVTASVRAALGPDILLGVSGEGVVGGESEIENAAGLALLGLHLPGVGMRAFRTDQWPAMKEPPTDEGQLRDIAASAGIGPDYRGSILFADPFSVPMNAILPALSRARSIQFPQGGSVVTDALPPIIGGLASAAKRPGGNTLILNDSLGTSGGIGVSFSGPVRIDPLVSQGCKPIGPPLVITSGKGQMVSGLGGRPAMHVLSEIIESLDEQTKERLRKGLFVGRAVSEYKERFGRDDFLIRNVIGVEQSSGSIAVADLLRVGQTIQFHVRDETTAAEDLSLLLDAQLLRDDPFAALLFTCNGRGSRLFSKPHHDAAMISRAFNQRRENDPFAADSGAPHAVSPRRHLPLSGFFAGGEIGPVGSSVFVHGQTACLALFRAYKDD